MGRPPVLRKAILQVLRKAEKGLGLRELTLRVRKELTREVRESSVSNTLRPLTEKKEVVRDFAGSMPVYTLAGQLHVESLVDTVSALVKREVSGNVSKLIDNGLITHSVPYTVFLVPPQDEDDIIGRADVFRTVRWNSPADGIASLLLNDFHCLEPEERQGITRLLEWAYWCGTREYSERFLPRIDPRPLKSRLQELKRFIVKEVEAARTNGDKNKERGEHAILQILELTEKLVGKQTLADFLTEASANKYRIEELQTAVLDAFDTYTSAGEQIFDDLVNDVYAMIMSGLQAAGLWDSISDSLPGHMLAAHDVWISFVSSIIWEDLEDGADLKNVRGNRITSRQKVRLHARHIDTLVRLMRARQVAALYLWGFPEVDVAAEKDYKLGDFDDWLKALENGQLDHRVWLFEERTFRLLRVALKAVREGGSPPPLRIDKEPWNLADLYKGYHRGCEVEFWEKLRDTLWERKSPANEAQFRAAVPPGLYSAFKRGEREAVLKRFHKEEEAYKQNLSARKRKAKRAY